MMGNYHPSINRGVGIKTGDWRAVEFDCEDAVQTIIAQAVPSLRLDELELAEGSFVHDGGWCKRQNEVHQQKNVRHVEASHCSMDVGPGFFSDGFSKAEMFVFYNITQNDRLQS